MKMQFNDKELRWLPPVYW